MAEPQPLCAIVTPMGMLGYGFDERQVTAKLDDFKQRYPSLPAAVIMDSGSTDSGPSKLALGTMTCPEESYLRDLTKLVRICINDKVPVLLSSAGGDGSNEHVDVFVDMIKEIAQTLHCPRKLEILAVYSEISKEIVQDRLATGNITGCGHRVPALTPNEIQSAPRILGQMGPEPILQAMTATPSFDILVAGRAYDPATFVSFCAMQHPKSLSSETVLGGFYHMGKILECGGLCATPKSAGAAALVYADGAFDVSPLDPAARCTPLSVAAHTLYEKARPDILHGPGGLLDLTETTYEPLADERTVRVRGATFRYSVSEGQPYTLKLEAARVVGHRNLFMGSFKDPILTVQIDAFLDGIKARIAQQHGGAEGKWKLDFHKYGAAPGEVFIVGEVLADDPVLAKGIASTARIFCSHAPYEGQMATSGNFAFGIGGRTEIDVGACSEFSIYHLMNLVAGEEGGQRLSDSAATKIVARGDAALGLFTWTRIETEASTTATNSQAGLTPPDSQKSSNGLASLATSSNGVRTPATANGRDSKPQRAPRALKDIAKVIRSKNAGPFEITFDVIFDDKPVYEAVKASGMLSRDAVAALFGRPLDDVVWCGFFDQAMAFKVTFPRMRGGELRCSGGFMENDVHGSQQYLPLVDLPLPEGVVGLDWMEV